MGERPLAEGTGSLVASVADAPAFQRFRSRLEEGGVSSWTGVSSGAQAFVAALIRRWFPSRPVVLVLEGLKAQEAAFQDVQTWLPSSARGLRPHLFYPDWEILPHEPKLPHVDVISDRLVALDELEKRSADGAGPFLVASVTALMQRTFSRSQWTSRRRSLSEGTPCDPLDLVEWLEEQGYEPEAQVSLKSTLALRGGILDVWSPGAPWPVRIEFFGDQVESLREFDPMTQLSRERLGSVVLSPAGELGLMKRMAARAAEEGGGAVEFGTLLDHLPPEAVLVLSSSESLGERARAYADQVPDGDPFFEPWDEVLARAGRRGDTIVELSDRFDAEPGGGSVSGSGTMPRIESLETYRPMGTRIPEAVVAEAQRREFFGQMHRWLRQGMAVHVICNNDGERQRFREVWTDYGLMSAPGAAESARLSLHLGALSRGFLVEAAGFVVVTDAEIFGRYKVLRPRRLKAAHAQTSRSLLDIDFTDLEEGDLVVHVEHGIGRFLGLQVSPVSQGHRGLAQGPGQECLAIEYAPSVADQPAPRLYVPVSEAHLVSKYVGAGKARPPLNSLGGTRWAKARKDAERAVADLAAELLEIQAARDTQPGHAFPPDSAWQREFEASFLFEETADQVRAIEATKRDQESPRPMDRLICGDVGFGKTEVAIRAAFKTVMGGKQVAILVPTTVLAQQHANTFQERMSDYPVRIELLSRFRSKREQRLVLEKLEAGSVDIVIGTHRLLQADVRFKDLGLVVIDEEQRFGVMHKERFKLLRRTVDVLTLTATPIPRTLHLALSGARDMSTIETPPQDRLPVETIVAAYDDRLVRDAIQRELNRQGQVFFLHNRVTTIEAVALRIKTLVPHARLVVGHGQMDPDDLEEVMTRFVNGEADVLVSTTIVESGLDIPNANTILIDRADRFGLSELYQLRGRVGRYKHQAYAYLLIPRHAQLLSEARKRISAIRQYSSLGSGFKIAMRDLEIRGAGNLLGAQQSGHITAVGFELYCQLLQQSVAALKGEKVRPRVEVQVRLDFLPLNPAEESRTQSARPSPAGSHRPGNVRGSQGVDSNDGPLARAFAGLPASYVPDPRQRVDLHRRLAQVFEPTQIRRFKEELKDRYGPLPGPVELLIQITELRLLAAGLGVTAMETRDDKQMLTRGGQRVQVGGRFPRLTKREPKSRLL
ncbi:MAG: transcription-repair coupling factor [Limisphaerales bacterium]